MKAALLTDYGDPDVLKLGDLPDPTPGPGEALVRVEAAGLNRLDHYLRLGAVTRDLALPHVLGSDASGVVETVGEGVADLAVGDRVLTMPGFPLDPSESGVEPLALAPSFTPLGLGRPGCYAQYVSVPARWLVRDDTGLTAAEAATLPMVLVTCVRAVKTVGGVGPGQRVLVHAGASGTGAMSVQVAKALGAAVAATVRTPAKADYVRGLGADLVVTLNEMPRVGEWSGGGVDVVIDNLGGEVLGQSLDVLRPGGVLVAMGFVRGANVGFDVQQFFFAQKQVRGTLMGGVADLRWGLGQVKAGRVRPNLDRTFALADAAAAHRVLAAGGARGNLVLLPWQ